MLEHYLDEMWTRQRPDIRQAATIATEESHSNRFHRPLLPDRQISHSCSPISTRHLSLSFFAHNAFCWDMFILCCSRCVDSVILWISVCSSCIQHLSLNQMKITSFSNCFELISFVWQFDSVSSLAGVSLSTSSRDRGKVIRMTADCASWFAEQWICGSSYRFSTSSSTAVIFFSVRTPIVCRCCASVDAIFKNISQGSVATPMRCDEVCNYLFIANFPLSVTAKEQRKSVNIWRRYGQEFGVFFTHSLGWKNKF